MQLIQQHLIVFKQKIITTTLLNGNYDEDELEQRKQCKLDNNKFVIEDRIKNTHTSLQECNRFLIANMGDNSECVYLHQHIDKGGNDDEK